MTNKITTLGGFIYEYQKSVSHPEDFWGSIAETFYWQKKFDKVLEWDFEKPDVKWFLNGKLNITENIFERHMFERKNQPALIWEPNNPKEKQKVYTYKELYDEVRVFANMLLSKGIRKGDRVVIYLPMIPELTIAMLACARIGAIHSVIFAGFSVNAVADRVKDAGAKMIITSDGGFRGTKTIPLKEIIDEAMDNCDCNTVKNILVIRRTGQKVAFMEDRDIWLEDALKGISKENDAEVMESEDPLFILYTSGSTGQPKGLVHSTAGYMVYTSYSFKNIFQYSDGDVFFCSADIGWITGHSYIVYGPLLAGATTVMYEGTPTYPDAGRFWDIVEKYKVNQFYTAPTAIRALMGYGQKPFAGKDLSSLKVLGSVGEPINEEAWHWYHDFVGQSRCPIVDTWWQTETGGIMISPLAGITPTKPSYATLPFVGIQPAIMNGDGKEQSGKSVEGNLCIKFPWPGMARTVWGDHKRYKKTYFSQYKGYYFTGDGVKRDEDGYYRILGRVDDVINVSGHRLGTAEIENAINEHPLVVESAVVGYPHKVKGQGIFAFVVCQELSTGGVEGIKTSVKKGVEKIIGPIAKPDEIRLVEGLPKTRSGKIMRRILRKIAEGDTKDFGDTTTLLDPGIVDSIIENECEKKYHKKDKKK